MDDYVVVEEKTVGPYTVKVLYDTDPMEPFDEDMPETWGIDLSNHRDYDSPTYGEAMPVSMQVAMDPDPEDKWDRMQFFKNYYVVPVYMYEHGGRTVSTSGFSCPWDSGMAGFVYMHKKTFAATGIYGVRKSWSAAKRAECALKYLKGTVEELDAHMTGQVFGFVVEKDDEEVDSCWGFVGDSEFALEDGVASAEHSWKHDQRERLCTLKTMITHRVPLEIRQHQLAAR